MSGVDTIPKSIDIMKHAKKYSNDMQNLLDRGTKSDVIFVLDGFKLPAHKIILAARSPVFEAMFSHEECKESQEGLVYITDVPVAAFKELIRYVYTGKIPDKEQLTLDLMAAADKV